jgi:hypothetical protein
MAMATVMATVRDKETIRVVASTLPCRRCRLWKERGLWWWMMARDPSLVEHVEPPAIGVPYVKGRAGEPRSMRAQCSFVLVRAGPRTSSSKGRWWRRTSLETMSAKGLHEKPSTRDAGR